MLKRAQLRDASSGAWLDFQGPEAVLTARLPEEVRPVLERVERFCRQGGYAAGYLAYEAAAAFDRAFPVAATAAHGPLPLAVFGLFAAPQQRHRPDFDAVPGGGWRLEESFDDYEQRIDRLRGEIGRGNVYQVNYTVRAQGENLLGDARLAAEAVRAPFGAFLDFEAASVVSASPELFFDLKGKALRSMPMKGTAARGRNAVEDDAQRRWLQESQKNRAENLMITDMVRNDLGRVAVTGTVCARDVFAVRDYATVWQMTSEVRAQTRAALADVFAALFPAASITGAPKLASAALIQELEVGPRGIYTGAIGFVAPDPGGIRAQFNVAIRTGCFDHEARCGSYGVGGGIVWDSEAREEYAEIATKMQVLSDVRLPEASDTAEADARTGDRAGNAPFLLLETLRWSEAEGHHHLRRHLDRLSGSARYYGFPYEEEAIREALSAEAKGANGGPLRRVRLTLGPEGEVQVASWPLQLVSESQPVMLASTPVDGRDLRLRHKTTRRGVYERAQAEVPEGVEALLWNEAGFVTESSIANVVFERQGRCWTPPLSDGLLPGVLRQTLLEEGRIQERQLAVQELVSVDALYLINGLRGWRRARLVPVSDH